MSAPMPPSATIGGPEAQTVEEAAHGPATLDA